MRNLKRALSLALAAVMVLSMMVIGAGAVSIDDFSDKDEIVNTEAVTTMVSLGVINGKDDGSYDPTGIVTRAEMAKLISVMLNGGKDPTLGEVSANFTDTAGHWAESYIAYVANLSIIDGRGDGTFGPNDQVTGAQAAKMLLTALGYRSEIEGFTGANWAINVQLKANDIDLFADLVINPDEGLTRDETAQMIYNAVQAQEVEYRNLDGNYNDVIYPTMKGTMLANRFGVIKVEGVVAANDVFAVPGSATTTAGRTRLIDTNTYITTGTNGQNVTRNYDGVYNVSVDNDMVGTRIVIYVKFQNALAPNAVNSTVVGTPISSEKNTIAETTKRLKDDSAVRSFLSDNGLTIPSDGVAADDTHGTLFFTENDTDDTAAVTRAFAVTATSNVNGTELKFIDHDDDGVVDYIFKTLPRMAKITVYNEKDESLTIAGEGSIDFDDIANVADVAKDDIVLYHKVNETYYMEKAETVTGVVEAYNNNKTVTVDGASYGKSTVSAELSSTDLTEFGAEMPMVGNTYTFYMDNNGNVVAWVLGEESIGNYAIILAADVKNTANFESASVKLLMADGSVATYDVNLLASANKFGVGGATTAAKEAGMVALFDSVPGDANDGQGLNNMIVTYVVGENGKVTIGDPAAVSNTYDSVTAGAAYTADATAVARNVARYTFDNTGAGADISVSVNDSTIFFIRNISGDGTVYSVVNGLSKLPTTAIARSSVISAVYSVTNANPNVAKAVVVDGTFRGTANYVYVTDSYIGTKNVNGEEVYTYPVVFEDGAAGTLSINRDNVVDGMAYEYTVDSNGVAAVQVTGDIHNGFVSTYAKGSNLSVRTGNGKPDTTVTSYTVLSDANLWNVEGEPYAETLTNDMSMCFITDSDGFVKTVFVNDTNATLTTNISAAAGLGLGFNSRSVYSGYDVEVTGAASGDVLAYVVTYDNGKTETKTVKVSTDNVGYISVPKNAASIRITAVNGNEGGEGETPAPGVDSIVTLTGYSSTDYNFYVNNVAVDATAIRGGVTVAAKTGDKLVIEAKADKLASGKYYAIGDGKVYTADASKGIEVTVTDKMTLAAPVQMFSATVPTTATLADLGDATVTWTVDEDAILKDGVYYLPKDATIVATVSLDADGFTTAKANAKLTAEGTPTAVAAITTATNDPESAGVATAAGAEITFPGNAKTYTTGVFTFTWTVNNANVTGIDFSVDNA